MILNEDDLKLIEAALKNAKESLEKVKTEQKWQAVLGHLCDFPKVRTEHDKIVFYHNLDNVNISITKNGDKFQIGYVGHGVKVFVWEKLFCIPFWGFKYQRKSLTFLETLDVMAEIKVAGKPLNFEVG